MTSNTSTLRKKSRSGDVRCSNKDRGNKHRINRASNNGQAKNKSSYKGECEDLGSIMFYISNIKQADNFNTVSETIIAYIKAIVHARVGHRSISGDGRVYQFQHKYDNIYSQCIYE